MSVHILVSFSLSLSASTSLPCFGVYSGCVLITFFTAFYFFDLFLAYEVVLSRARTHSILSPFFHTFTILPFLARWSLPLISRSCLIPSLYSSGWYTDGGDIGTAGPQDVKDHQVVLDYALNQTSWNVDANNIGINHSLLNFITCSFFLLVLSPTQFLTLALTLILSQ